MDRRMDERMSEWQEAKAVNGLDIAYLVIGRKGKIEYCVKNTVQLKI